MKTFRAWIQPPVVNASGDTAFPWNSAAWIAEPRLIPERFATPPRGGGSASFRLLRRYRQDEGQKAPSNAGSAMETGVWVAITADTDVAGVAPSFNLANLRFWGLITSVDTDSIGDNRGGYLGTVTASGPGSLLDQAQLDGWLASNGMGGTTAVDSPPTANLEGKGGIIVGNHVSISGQPVFAFSALECGQLAANYWTRYRLLQHVLTNCLPGYLPAITLSIPSPILSVIDDTTLPEVLDVRSLTLQGVLDYCLPRPRGIGWRIDPVGSGWTVTAYALLDQGESGVPTQTPTNPNLSGLAVVRVAPVNQDTDVYDQVVVQGAPIIFCGSLKANDPGGPSVRPGWSSAQETAWKSGASGSDGYASLTLAKKADRNDQVRGGAALEDVWTRYIVGSPSSATAVPRSTAPGTTDADPTLPFFPEISWDGTTATFNNAKMRDPSWPSSTIARTIPWQRGVHGDGTDDRSAAEKAQPQFLPPLVFTYAVSLLGNPTWQDLSKEGPGSGNSRHPPFSIDVDDRGTALRIKGSPPEWLAKGDWTSMEPTRLQPTAGASTPPTWKDLVDWRSLVVTVAMPSDQTIKITKTRDGVAAGEARRKLVIQDDSLQSWWIFAGTVVGIKGDTATGGTTAPDRVATTTHVRNDWPRAERLARLAAAWALSTRQSVTITLATDTPPSWASIGQMIGTITDGANQLPTYSVVENLSMELGEEPRLTITTDLPERPSFGAQGIPMSPAGGGGISLALGGTLAQAMHATQGDVRDLKAAQQQQPVTPPRPGIAQTPPPALVTEVVQAAHGFTVGQAVYNNAGTWTLATNSTPEDVGLVVAVVDVNTVWVATWGVVYLAGATYTAGEVYYLTSTAGTVTTTAGTPKRALFYAADTDLIVLFSPTKAGIGTAKLVDLDDVNAASPSNLQALTYDTASSKWIATTISGASFGPQAANLIFAGPTTGAAAAPTFRAQVLADLPSIAATSVIANATGSAAVPGALAAAADNQALLRIGGALVFAQVPDAAISGLATTKLTGVLQAAQFPALTGDVTTSAGALATTIAANVVTYAKMQQVAASSLVGNPTGALANAQGITLGATLAFSGSALQTAAMTGDVTATANSFATTIAAGAVTLAKMANLAANSIIGNNTGSPATPIALTAAQVKTLLAISFADVSGTLAATAGGTGQSTYAVGDLLYASTTSALSKLADVATGSALISGGVGVAPSWGKIGLTTHVSGTLPVANGGTNSATALSGSSIMVSNGSAIVQGAAGTSTTVLHGNAAGAPTYGAVSLTADVSGTLPVANGGTGATTLTGFVRGSGTAALTASAIVSADLPAINAALTTDTTTAGAAPALDFSVAASAGGIGTIRIYTAKPLYNANKLQGKDIDTTAPTNAQILVYNATAGKAFWADGLTTRGDILIGTTANAYGRLGIGAANTVLKSDGTDPSWVAELFRTNLSVTHSNVSSSVSIPAGKRWLFVCACGGGGSGGAGSTVTSGLGFVASVSGGSPTTALNQYSGGGGGGNGSSIIAIFQVSGGETLAWTVGSGGASQASAGTSGNAGSSTTVTLNASTIVTAPGGPGGPAWGVAAGVGSLPSTAGAVAFQVGVACSATQYTSVVADASSRSNAGIANRGGILYLTSGASTDGMGGGGSLSGSSSTAGNGGFIQYAWA